MSVYECEGEIQATENGIKIGLINVFWPSWNKLSEGMGFVIILRMNNQN